MQIPDTPAQEDSPAAFFSSSAVFDSQPHIMIQGGNVTVNPHKRQKIGPVSWTFGTSTERKDVRQPPQRDLSPRSGKPRSQCSLSNNAQPVLTETAQLQPSNCPPGPSPVPSRSMGVSIETATIPTPSLRQSRIRDLLPVVIHEALRIGGRPDSSVGQSTPLGERIEVRTRSSNGHASYQVIEWSVHPDVPEVLPIDERDLSKLISCVFLNAVKFTDNGSIAVVVSLSESQRSVRINIIDNGAGIPKDFVPELFKPFSRGDASLTRSREGLGLGLLVAKGVARKLGGDLNLVRTETSGERKGSEFEIKIPIGGAESGTRPGTPLNRSPTPSSSSPSLPRPSSSYIAMFYPSMGLPTPLSASSERQAKMVQLNSSDISGDPTASSTAVISSPSPKVPMSNKSAFDRKLAEKHPLTFLVAEDNKINRKLLVNMLVRLGYKDIYEAFDGREAVRIMSELTSHYRDGSSPESQRRRDGPYKPVDIILMDLWMPEMDGYEATEKILDMFKSRSPSQGTSSINMAAPVVLAVSADVTQKAISRATAVGMEGFMTKPYKLYDLQRLIEEVCSRNAIEEEL